MLPFYSSSRTRCSKINSEFFANAEPNVCITTKASLYIMHSRFPFCNDDNLVRLFACNRQNRNDKSMKHYICMQEKGCVYIHSAYHNARNLNLSFRLVAARRYNVSSCLTSCSEKAQENISDILYRGEEKELKKSRGKVAFHPTRR